MRLRLLASGFFTITMFVSAHSAQAVPVVDQEYLPFATLVAQARSIDYWGQAWTVGQLSSVEIAVHKEPGVTADIDFNVFRILNGVATFPSLAAVTVPNAHIPLDVFPNAGVHQLTSADLFSIDLSSFNIQVQQGEVIGMVVHSSIGFNEPR
jgi:hypothetical protein